MTTTPALEAVEEWLIEQALAAQPIPEMFAGMCLQMRTAGLDVDRALLGWVTLHPLFEAESALWLADGEMEHLQHRHDAEENEDWLLSPVRAVLESGDDRLRRHLSGGNADLDFPLCVRLRGEGYTDYLVLRTEFRIPAVQDFSGRTGIIVSWATRVRDGFDDIAIGQIEYLQRRLALACQASIQGRIAATIAETYLGRRAGSLVLSGRIRHGDGEVIDAVIFYCDMRDSTALAERLGPAAYLRHLNAYFSATAGVVAASGGEVLDFIGDAVLAVFPTDEGGVAAAARRALAAVAGIRAGICGEAGEEGMRCGIALSCGQVTFGNIGIADRLTFSVIGQTVNAAARIEALTKTLSCPVLVTEEIAEIAPFAFVSVGSFMLDGFSAPLELFCPEDGVPVARPAG